MPATVAKKEFSKPCVCSKPGVEFWARIPDEFGVPYLYSLGKSAKYCPRCKQDLRKEPSREDLKKLRLLLDKLRFHLAGQCDNQGVDCCQHLLNILQEDKERES